MTKPELSMTKLIRAEPEPLRGPSSLGKRTTPSDTRVGRREFLSTSKSMTVSAVINFAAAGVADRTDSVTSWVCTSTEGKEGNEHGRNESHDGESEVSAQASAWYR